MPIDTTKPNDSLSIGDNIDAIRENFEAAETDISSNETSLTTHEADITAAHGLASILTSIADYVAHKANEIDAHGIDDILTDVASALSTLSTAAGSKASLDERLTVSINSDGSLKLTGLTSTWIEPGHTPTYVSNISFTVPDDKTLVYKTGCVLAINQTGGWVYGVIDNSSYGGSVTTVTLESTYTVILSSISEVKIALYNWNNTVESSVTTNASDIVDIQSQLTGYLVSNVTTITSADSPYTVLATDRVILCNCTSGAIEVDFPASVNKRQLSVKKIDSSGNAVTLDMDGSETIDGAATDSLAAQYDCITTVGDGSNWHIISEI